MPYVLRCRIEECENAEGFDSTEQINNSNWTEINPMGSRDKEWSDVGESWYHHPAFCPDHSFPDV